jgi:hypothetical protein
MQHAAPLLAILLALAAPAFAAPTVWVTVPEPEAPCSFEDVAGALRSRLGTQDVRHGEHAVDGQSVQLALGHQGTDWFLDLESEGHPRLRRPLPGPEADCLALTEAAALVADRYLDDVHWSGAPVLVEPVPPEEHPVPEGFHAGLDAAIAGGSALSGVGGGVELHAGIRWDKFLFGLSGGAQLPSDSALVAGDPTQGSLHAEAGTAQLLAGRFWNAGPGALELELTPGLEWFRSWTTGGQIYHRQDTWSAAPYLGARAGYAVALGRHFYVAARAQGEVLLVRQVFEVYGYSPTLQAQVVQWEGSLAVGYQLF